jgi:hypothetical protein
MNASITSNIAKPPPWRDPACWLYGLGALLVLAALGILASQARSSDLQCSLEAGRCVLLHTNLLESSRIEFKVSEVSRLDVQSARRRATLDFITPSGPIAFAHDTAYPPARDIAKQFEAFRTGQAGPRLAVRYEELPAAIPHAAIFLVIGLMLLAGGWVQGWLARKSLRR